MRIDAYTHFVPPRFLAAMDRIGGAKIDIGKRIRGVPSIWDLDERLRVVEKFDDYGQILSYSQPPIEAVVGPDRIEEMLRVINDDLAEIVRRRPDRFPGFVAQVSLADPEGAVREAERAIRDLGACGVQIYTNVAGKPLDLPEHEVFFAGLEALDKPIWIHPARGADFADYKTESRSKFEIWWTFGWSYETAAAMARLVFSGILDRHPKLKPIVHHFGGIVPMLEGRIGPGWDQIGARTSDEDLQAVKNRLKKRPLDYFKQNFIADTAVFGADAATVCGLAFYPADNVVFASDCPFDPEKGPGYIRETLRILDSLDLPKEVRAKIDHQNLERITGKTFVK